MNLYMISNTALITALFVYIVSFFCFTISITARNWSKNDAKMHTDRWGKISFRIVMAGFGLHLVYFVTRWIGNGFIPVSNLFEFMTFLSMMAVCAFVIIYLIYRKALIGVFATPVAIIILAYAMVFPWEAQPLIPSLNSVWLYIHVTTAATGEAFFAVAFASGLMYLLRTVDFQHSGKKQYWQKQGVEFTLFVVLIVLGFIVSVFGFRAIGYEATFAGSSDQQREASTVVYALPPLVGPDNMQLVSMDSFLGMDKPLLDAPSWMKGVNAGRKLNTVIWSVIAGLLIYLFIRLILRQTIGKSLQPILREIDPEDLDEISYRAIAIGFPIFTLGALIFAMIWAHLAWNRFWGWDPKEVWALITWLFYSAYLHLRLGRGWHGTSSAWMAVLGFVVVMFTLIGVNLVIAGLHSYAGV
jgi:cytochrome c-type biogenesis protein CcsB